MARPGEICLLLKRPFTCVVMISRDFREFSKKKKEAMLTLTGELRCC